MGLFDNCIEGCNDYIASEVRNVEWYKKMVLQAEERIAKWRSHVAIYQELNAAYDKDPSILGKISTEVEILIRETEDREDALHYASELGDQLGLSKEVIIDEIERQYNALTEEEAHKNNT